MISSSTIERRLKALEKERSIRHPERELAFLGTSEEQTAAQFARAVQDGRAAPDEPYLSIIMAGPAVGDDGLVRCTRSIT